MSWLSIAGVVGKAVPILGTLLAGPAGSVVGTLISSVLGTADNPDSVSTAVQSDPNALVKLQDLATIHKIELEQLLVTSEQNRLQAETTQYLASVDDRKNARSFAETQPKDFIRPIVTVVLLVGALVILFLVFSGKASDVIKDPTASLTLGTVIGFWFNELKQTLGFYFGTTKESNAQNNAIAAFATSPGTVTNEETSNK
jgi:hypothetical protein